MIAAFLLLQPSLEVRRLPGYCTPRSCWQWCLLGVLFVYGALPYLGLSTTGTFTMFSNLVTEGPASNHLLLGSNPLKIVSLQEDMVHIDHVDERFVRPGPSFRRMPYPGQSIPRVHLQNLLHAYSRYGLRDVTLLVTYKGRPTEFSTSRLPHWLESPSFAMRMLAFRDIFPPENGDRTCRW